MNNFIFILLFLLLVILIGIGGGTIALIISDIFENKNKKSQEQKDGN
jgi:flagellar basal body-associated protein FliL